MATRRREVLRAVHDDDLQQVLTSLGIYGDFAAGRLTCSACGDIVTGDSLYAIYPDSGQVKVACNKPDCIERLLELRSNRQ